MYLVYNSVIHHYSQSIHTINPSYVIYTMYSKFSDCFVWMSPSTPDLEFHLMLLGYMRRSSDKNFHLKKIQKYQTHRLC